MIGDLLQGGTSSEETSHLGSAWQFLPGRCSMTAVMEREIEPREGARLRASEKCCALFIARGTTDLTITEIASEIGISQRTLDRKSVV